MGSELYIAKASMRKKASKGGKDIPEWTTLMLKRLVLLKALISKLFGR